MFADHMRQGGSVPVHYRAISHILSKPPFYKENHLKALRLLEANPRMTQRDMADALGVSLGKANYCLRALLDKGLIKMQNFRNSQNKRAYAYLLTPAGIAARAELTLRFLQVKIAEYESLKQEIEALGHELGRKPKDGEAE